MIFCEQIQSECCIYWWIGCREGLQESSIVVACSCWIFSSARTSGASIDGLAVGKVYKKVLVLLVFVLLLNLLMYLLLSSVLVQESSIAVVCSSTAASRTRTSECCICWWISCREVYKKVVLLYDVVPQEHQSECCMYWWIGYSVTSYKTVVLLFYNLQSNRMSYLFMVKNMRSKICHDAFGRFNFMLRIR